MRLKYIQSIIDCIYFKRIQKFLLFNLKMTVERSKRRCFLELISGREIIGKRNLK